MRRLSAAQRRHLTELAGIADGNHGVAFWRPANGPEWACAYALTKRGLLKREYGNGAGGAAFSITAEGIAEAVMLRIEGAT